MEAAHQREDVIPRAPHPILRRVRRRVSGGAALSPSADQLLAHRRGQTRQELRALRVVHRRIADVVAERTGARGVEHQSRVEHGAGGDQSVVEAPHRVGARVEITEPSPEPATVLERTQPRGLGQPKSLRRELAEHVHVLHRIDAGQRGLGAPGRVLVHEDRQAARVGACARTARGVGSHGHVELDRIHTGVGQRVDLGFGSRRIEATTETGEPRVRIAFLEHRSGEEDAWAGPSARVDGGAVRRDVVELAAEIQHGGDAGGQEELRMPFFGRVDVHVHVDEPGDHELAPAVDHRGALGDVCRCGGTDRENRGPLNDDRGALERGPPGSVEGGGADNGEPVDFSHRLNPIVVDILDTDTGFLPTGLSTPVHNLRARRGPRRTPRLSA